MTVSMISSLRFTKTMRSKKLNFSNYEGKWLVLLFYPADFIFVCPTELEEAAEYYAVRAGTFIIDPDGVMKAMDIHDNSIGRSAEEILRKLQAASFVEAKRVRRVGNREEKHSSRGWTWWGKSRNNHGMRLVI